MQIDRIEIFHLALPWKTPPDPGAALETVVVRIDGGGASGWGEASPGNAPQANGEWAGGAWLCLRDWLAPAIVGGIIDSGDDLSERLDRFGGNRFAKAALDGAWWDLSARLQNRPLHALLGGVREAVEVGASFDQMASIDALLAAIGRVRDAGCPRVELKFRPGWDLEMLRVVRQEFPTLTIHVDFDGRLGLEHAEMLYRLDDFGLAMIEQPLAADDLVGHAMIQENLRTPICLDESIATPAQAEMALDLHSCRWVNLKLGRVGGLTSAVAIHDACHEHCTPCWVGAPPQTAVGCAGGFGPGRKGQLHLSRRPLPFGRRPCRRPCRPIVARPAGRRRAPRPALVCPGIGVEPEGKLLKKFCLQRAKFP